MPYALLSYATLKEADFSGANLLQAVMHRIDDKKTNWHGANRKNAQYTDKDLTEAEDWEPPKPEEHKLEEFYHEKSDGRMQNDDPEPISGSGTGTGNR